jgi:hypothetical protein
MSKLITFTIEETTINSRSFKMRLTHDGEHLFYRRVLENLNYNEQHYVSLPRTLTISTNNGRDIPHPLMSLVLCNPEWEAFSRLARIKARKRRAWPWGR